MTIRGVDYIYYEVSDVQRSKEFYKDVLGLKMISASSHNDSESQWVEFDLGNMTLGIGSYSQGGAGGTMAAFSVDNVTNAVEELKAKGVSVTMGPEDFPVCEMAVVTDPDGNKIMLHHRKDGTVG